MHGIKVKIPLDSSFTSTTRWIQEFHTDVCIGNNKNSQREEEMRKKQTMLPFNYTRKGRFPINTSMY
jgi:hypothetical protein